MQYLHYQLHTYLCDRKIRERTSLPIQNDIKLRIAFTIIYEGMEHLQHLDFAEKMASMFDHWVVVEGHALPNGSTGWCNQLSVSATSQDGTVKFMEDFAATHPNVHFYSHKKYFNSKDEQVNYCINIIKKLTSECWLWEVDVDEHWKPEDLNTAEQVALDSSNNGFSFGFNHYVGKGIVAVGDWGSGFLNRLWKWNGELFFTHEPAMLRGQRHTTPISEVKFNHYSYYFEQSVKFKSLYYSGHENVYKNWHSIQQPNHYPINISQLFGAETGIGKSNSQIILI